MKGCGTSVTQITAGIRADVEKLLQRFIDVASVRFEHFAKCFKDMKFSLIYSGRSSENELREFAEKLFLTILPYCFPPYCFQVNVGAIYLLYSVYYLQRKKYRMNVRVTPEQVEALKNLILDLKSQQHLDTCYTLLKLFRDHAFHIVAFPDEHNPLNYHRFDNKEDLEKTMESVSTSDVFIQEIVNDRLISQLDTVHDRYVEMKTRLFENDKLPDALNMIQENPKVFIEKVINECETKLESKSGKRKKRDDSDVPLTQEEKRQKLKERRSAIKERAYQVKIEARTMAK